MSVSGKGVEAMTTEMNVGREFVLEPAISEQSR